jgi:hypothetical protein
MKLNDCDFGLDDDLRYSETLFAEFVQKLSCSFEDDPVAQQKVLEVIFFFIDTRIYFSRRHIKRFQRIMAAKKMLQAGVGRREIVPILVERFGISSVTARKVRDFAEGEWTRERSRNAQRIAKQLSGQTATHT